MWLNISFFSLKNQKREEKYSIMENFTTRLRQIESEE